MLYTHIFEFQINAVRVCVCARVYVVGEISLEKPSGNIPTDVICVGIKQTHFCLTAKLKV